MRYLTAADVVAIHNEVIGAHELQGLAEQRPITAIVGRIEYRLFNGMIKDVYELAACYACYIALGHAFNDANKRTAFACMDVCLALNGIKLGFDTEEAGNMIISAVQKQVDEVMVAAWLRQLKRVK